MSHSLRIAAAVLIGVCAAGVPYRSGGDEIKDRLSAAKTERAKAVESARIKADAALVQAYHQAISDYTKNGEPHKAAALQKELDKFIAAEKTSDAAADNAAETIDLEHAKTKTTERAVPAALSWLTRHQRVDGSWSLNKFSDRCAGVRCDGPGGVDSDASGTALGLLPFLAAGQTHMTKGPYQNTVRRALNWLVAHQDPKTGDLSANGSPQARMYSHGLCAIALCEAYGLTKDQRLGNCAQAAIKFIEAAQDPNGGGWRYQPQQAGDTSVLGWQVTALKSAQVAGLQVAPATLDGARKYLAAASSGDLVGLFAYQPGGGKAHTMTAVGVTCRQYLGVLRRDRGIAEGKKVLLANLPDEKGEDRNIYYWYYGTQALYNMEKPDENWDTWSRKLRRVLVDTQAKGKDCSNGSWDPAKPSQDAWAYAGGRVMVTSLSCLCLQTYVHRTPLFDREEAKEAQKDSEKPNP